MIRSWAGHRPDPRNPAGAASSGNADPAGAAASCTCRVARVWSVPRPRSEPTNAHSHLVTAGLHGSRRGQGLDTVLACLVGDGRVNRPDGGRTSRAPAIIGCPSL